MPGLTCATNHRKEIEHKSRLIAKGQKERVRHSSQNVGRKRRKCYPYYMTLRMKSRECYK